MPNNSSFIIPINLQAIRVLEEDTNKFRGATVAFDNLASQSSSVFDINRDLSGATSPIGVGLHLHWSLPDCITHGQHEKGSGSLTFPVVPNRWLLTRYFTPTVGTTIPNAAAQQQFEQHGVCIQQWIIESNCITDPNTHTGVISDMVTTIPNVIAGSSPSNSVVQQLNPTLPGDLPVPPQLSYNYLGTATTYDESWSDSQASTPGNYDLALTVNSYYGPGFAAYYQNAGTVFGFHDVFADLGYNAGQGDLYGPSFKVSYQVIGWYADNNDIVQSTLAAAEAAYTNQNLSGSKEIFFLQYLQDELKWQPSNPFQTTSPPSDSWPANVQSFYNGLALDIVWQKEGSIADQSFLPDPSQVETDLNLQLAIGNNPAEALSALISVEQIIPPGGGTGNNEPYPAIERNVELLMNAFQQDLLRRLAGTDPSFQLPQIEEWLHSLRFSSRNGGTIWTVRPGKNSGASINGEIQLPLSTAELLSMLNAAQQTYDRQTNSLQSRQVQAYLDWTNWGLTYLAGQQSFNPADARPYIESELLQIFTESGKPGILNDTNNGNGTRSKIFDPVWTSENKTVANQIVLLATAENRLEILFPKAIQQIITVLATTVDTLTANNATIALATIQSLVTGNNNTDKDLQDELIQLQTLLAQPSATNTIWSSLNTAVKTTLPAELAVLQAANKNTTANPGLKDVIQLYQTSVFSASSLLKTFIAQQQANLFNATNLVDTQQSWLYVEAAAYDAMTLEVCGAKLNTAQSLIQSTIQDITVNIQPAFNSALAAVGSNFPILLTQLTNTTAQINGIITQIQAVISAPSSNPIATPIASLQTLISQLQTYYINTNANYTVASTLRKCWQSLLSYLPTGHQVMILAQSLKDAVEQIDPGNIVQTTSADPYRVPLNPVLVMSQNENSNETLLPVNRNGAATACPYRGAPDLLTTVELSKTGNSVTTPVNPASSASLPKVFANLGSKQDIVQSLLNEAYLLVPQTAQDLLTSNGYDSADIPLYQDIQQQLLNKLSTTQAYQFDPGPAINYTFSSGALTAGFNGILPYYIGLNLLGDTNPFLPLFMAWTADYEPIEPGAGNDNTVFRPDFIPQNFLLDTNEADMDYNNNAFLRCSGGSPDPIRLKGQVPLSTHSGANLVNQVRVYFNNIGIDITKADFDPLQLKNDFQKDLYDVYHQFSTRTILSQTLNGFNPGLLQQLPLLQAPLSNIDASDQQMTPLFIYLQQTWNDPRWNKVTAGQGIASDIFLPMRAGRLSLQQLFIVDSFGRYFTIGSATNPIQDTIAVAHSMSQETNLLAPRCNPNDTDKNDIYLPPRLLQPSRLTFNWLSAQAEESGENSFIERTKIPAYTPIAGWLLPNHLDDSIALFDNNGDALGSLGIEGQQLTWRSVPSASIENPSDNGRVQMLADISNANPFLQDFLTKFAFPSGGNAYFQNFLDALDQSQSFIHTHNLQQDKGLAVLIGRPFVLARAYLRLELMGLPNVALDADSFSTAINNFKSQQAGNPASWNDYDLSFRNNAGMMNVAVPVTLGDLFQFDDGLVGFFLGNDFTQFFTPLSNGNAGNVLQSTWETIQLLPNDANQSPSLITPPPDTPLAGIPQRELVVTIVMDPRASVHATTGILPVKSIQIPSVQYNDILQKLVVFFNTNPVLKSNQIFDLPLPGEKGYQWNWVQPGQPDIVPVPNTAGDRAEAGYSPQQLRDGWLKLKVDDKEQTQ